MSITWGTQLFDADNDADIDLFMAGGAPVNSFHGALFGNRPLPNALLVNDGTGQFTEQTARSGLAAPGPGIGTALVDIDRDGWLDLAVFSYRGRFRFYANRGARIWPKHTALRVELTGRGANLRALGAQVTLTTTHGQQQRCFNIPQPGLAGGSEVACHFGLGLSDIQSVAIQWPNGRVDTLDPKTKRGQFVRCSQPK
jgi:enediyne biosynthesis protein E4